MSASAGALAGMGILGYLWGREKDKKNVTVVIQQPEASGGVPEMRRRDFGPSR